MPRFLFHRWLPDSRTELATAELPDKEAARAYAIDLAGQILRTADIVEGSVTSRIEISDAEGNELDTLISEAF